MAATSFTLYKLQSTAISFDEYCEEIINKYNKELPQGSEFVEKEQIDKNKFEKVSNYKVFFSESQTKPDWQYPLQELVDNLPTIKNLNHSFVLFLECQDNIFAITGGKGYLVLQEYKDYNFGLELLSKILDPNDSIIKETNDRYLSGNKASGQHQFLGLVTLNSESSISNFFKGVDVFFKKERIEELFGVKIGDGRKDYKFVARDSVRLGKSLSVSDLDIFINSINKLLKQKTISNINNFYELNSRDPINNVLNELLVQEFKKCSDDQKIQSENLFLLQIQAECDKFNLLKKSTGQVLNSYEGHLDIQDIFKLYVEKFKVNIEQGEDKNVLDDFIKQIFVVGVIDGETPVEQSLLSLLDFKAMHNDKTYWLMNGKWVYLDETFIGILNEQFYRKVTSKYKQSKPLDGLKIWKKGISEGEYNFSHNTIENILVLDKIFVDNIEICDLLLIEETESFFIHVKNGLDRDARVLSEQIMSSMTAVNNAQRFGDLEFFKRYYMSISNKKKEIVRGTPESSLSKSARKFLSRFPSEQKFLEWINNPKIKHNFVFAFRPASQNINKPETIQSTPAKISMVNLIDYVKRFDFELSIVEIEK
ncbi:DUF6119 family protein [Bacillus paranthracis]|uniref:TIGR04141 family sporadically distributed protein n=1 Tax=Bacillus cereus (strain Q1) TaxID=361100 RepID=B9IS87_BACCQ|nr:MULTISPECIES: DUF6119 family protein [Bacillus cereus group]ACM11449.1 conserved hypothetical protein [Bacillus cereus Q1]MDA1498092.1 TIGR04141 family sporadically distributed protein [Bacillus cereus group sp. TH41-1LC]MDA1684196.1 TIGR04141 family sporadically distributed protein [Bacillus cereus group sp. m2-21]MDA1694834.1 TIGR04141 family sporadically distributed protein [Bacillus cereus group sp. m1-2]MDA1700015.1 TIGR04141 family sporadically distributed protein [Bacillus cereus gro